MKTQDVAPLMQAVGSVLREVLDRQRKHIDGIHDELIARIDGVISRSDRSAQQLAALHGRISALERKLLAKE